MAEVHKGRPRIWKDPSGNPPTLPPGVDSYDKCTVHSPSGQHFVGLFRQGVIDPVKVVSSNPRSDQYTPEQLYRNHYESARRQRTTKFVNLLRKASLAAGKGEVLPKTKGKEMPRSKLTLNEDSDNSSVSSTEIFGSSRRTSTQTMYSSNSRTRPSPPSQIGSSRVQPLNASNQGPDSQYHLPVQHVALSEDADGRPNSCMDIAELPAATDPHNVSCHRLPLLEFYALHPLLSLTHLSHRLQLLEIVETTHKR